MSKRKNKASAKRSAPAVPRKEFDISGTARAPENITADFKALNRLVLRNLNGRQHTPSFFKYTKDEIASFLKDPYSNENNLRDAAVYMYTASSHFRRIIQYFVGLSDFSYVVTPAGIDTSTANKKAIRRNYRKTLNAIESMDIAAQGAKILTVCLREDTCYVTMWVTGDNITMQLLPSRYCKIAVIEGNVMNVSFDFSYFRVYNDMLSSYPPEFAAKYEAYLNDMTNMRWQELDAPNSFAIKCNTDIPEYSVPPFAGVLRELYDLEDYKDLKLTKAALENYALLVMKLGVNSDGEWTMDFDKAKDFWSNLDRVVPEEVGTVLSPMDISKVSFEKSNAQDTDTITEAENHLFSAAGISSLLFNNEKASSNALLLSIKADQAITYGIVKSIGCAITRFIQAQSYGKNFKLKFLNRSEYNAKELCDTYLKACQYGLPFISYYTAAAGATQAEMDCMNFLEQDVLELNERFEPLKGSSTLSADDEGGRPKSDISELSDSGEASQERDDED